MPAPGARQGIRALHQSEAYVAKTRNFKRENALDSSF